MAPARDILVFGGTAEGRMLVEWLDARNTCSIVACTATDYGASLLPDGRNVTAMHGPLSTEKKHALMREHDFCCIVDATHPFALHISESIAALARDHGIDVLRVGREQSEEGSWIGVDSASEACAYLASTTGNILLTTGSKDLAVFAEGIPDFAQRVYARILPVPDSLEKARQLGIAPSHILAMQGPFSAQLNCALIREYDIGYLVTKQSGATGGFGEKLAAARECGVEVVAIRCPDQKAAISLEEAKCRLEEHYGL